MRLNIDHFEVYDAVGVTFAFAHDPFLREWSARDLVRFAGTRICKRDNVPVGSPVTLDDLAAVVESGFDDGTVIPLVCSN